MLVLQEDFGQSQVQVSILLGWCHLLVSLAGGKQWDVWLAVMVLGLLRKSSLPGNTERRGAGGEPWQHVWLLPDVSMSHDLCRCN